MESKSSVIYIVSHVLEPNFPFLTLPCRRKIVNRGWRLSCVLLQQEQNSCLTLVRSFHCLQRALDQTHKSLLTSVDYLKALLYNPISSIPVQFVGFTVFDWRKYSAIPSGKLTHQGVVVYFSLLERAGEEESWASAVVPRAKLFTPFLWLWKAVSIPDALPQARSPCACKRQECFSPSLRHPWNVVSARAPSSMLGMTKLIGSKGRITKRFSTEVHFPTFGSSFFISASFFLRVFPR